jgi:predicted phage terminase large subunit-like protein
MNSSELLALAARKTLERRSSLIEFTRHTFPQYRPAPHHQKIAEKLEAVERGEIDRLMIFMPPRHGKSELASKRFPAWYLGRNPSRQVITASYNLELAQDFGREVRNIVKEREYGDVFATELAADSQAAGRWNTNAKGAYVAAGVGTAITGRGAHLLLIDDPVKDREEAESERRRDQVWNWYTSTAYTRLMKGGAIILIQTRWHEDDLGGRLLEAEENGGDKWEKLILPALDGEQALWPEEYPAQRLQQIKAAIGPRDFSALYQQKPSPEEGTFFLRDWFDRHHAGTQPHCNVYITSDFAVTDGKGDYTEIGVWGHGEGGKLYQLDWWHGQTASSEWIERLIDLIARWKPLCTFYEQGVIEKAVSPMITQRMRERKVFSRIEKVPSIADKPTRARGFQARASMGNVSLLKDERGERVLSQLLTFPAGKHDDAVDVCSQIGMMIDQAHPAIIPVKETPKPRDAWATESVSDDVDWKTA